MNPKDAIGSRKASISTLPANVLLETGVAMMEGAAKYGRHNYREAPVQASVYYDAAFRHLASFWEGEDIDPDSGISHITKAIAGLMIMRDAMMNGLLIDDRPPVPAAFMQELNAKAAAICEKYPVFVKPYTEKEIT